MGRRGFLLAKARANKKAPVPFEQTAGEVTSLHLIDGMRQIVSSVVRYASVPPASSVPAYRIDDQHIAGAVHPTVYRIAPVLGVKSVCM
jgi:hypothetical protein